MEPPTTAPTHWRFQAKIVKRLTQQLSPEMTKVVRLELKMDADQTAKVPQPVTPKDWSLADAHKQHFGESNVPADYEGRGLEGIPAALPDNLDTAYTRSFRVCQNAHALRTTRQEDDEEEEVRNEEKAEVGEQEGEGDSEGGKENPTKEKKKNKKKPKKTSLKGAWREAELEPDSDERGTYIKLIKCLNRRAAGLLEHDVYMLPGIFQEGSDNTLDSLSKCPTLTVQENTSPSTHNTLSGTYITHAC